MGATLKKLSDHVPSVPTAQRFYRPELDGLRFFAFLLVFFHHCDWQFVSKISNLALRAPWAILSGYGWVGVNLFFILSGYLVTELLLRERDRTDDISLSKFYIRRILRIWPLYLAFLAVAMVVLPPFLKGALHWGGTAHREAARYYVLPLLGFVGNVVYLLRGYPLFHLLNPLWSISMEEQFYLAWPALIKNAKSRRNLAWIFVALIVGAAYFRLCFSLVADKFLLLWVNPLCQMDTFAIGGLLALGLRSEKFMAWLGRNFYLPYFGILFILPVVLNFRPWSTGDLSPVWRFACINVSLASVLTCALMSARWKKALSWGGLPWLGKISYGLYVWHLVGRHAAEAIVPVNENFLSSLLTTGLSLSITTVIAAVSYYGFERHFLKFKDKFSSVKSRPI